MDFSFTDDHLALREAVRRCCDGEFAAHQRGLPEDAETQARRHATFAELGLHGLLVPAAHGGSEMSSVEAMLTAQELGRALAGNAWMASAVMAAPLIAAAASPAQQDRWLGAIASGRLRVSLALEEPQTRWALTGLQCVARSGPPVAGEAGAAPPTGYLSGTKSHALDGAAAGLFLVLAQTPEGPTMFAVDAQAPGLVKRPHRLLDERASAHLDFSNTPAELVGHAGAGLSLAEAALERARALQVAETTGAAEALMALTLEHLRTRRQFGKPLASFQALQHRVADLAIALEQLKSMACVAALSLQADGPGSLARGVAAASTLASQLGRRLALDAIQLHGAMGMTEECAAARYAKRLLVNSALFGDAAFHRRRFAALPPLTFTGETA